MILIGQYDSPFVRRVGITLTLYGLPFSHLPWSVFADADRIRPLNPLVRVPTMLLGHGLPGRLGAGDSASAPEGTEVLIDSASIIDHLDGLVTQDRALIPRSGADRRAVLRGVALGTGLADKAVSLFYERRLHDPVSTVWDERCRDQMLSALGVMEAERAARMGGDSLLPGNAGSGVGQGGAGGLNASGLRSGRAGLTAPGTAGPGIAGSGIAGSGIAGSGIAGSGIAGSGIAGSGITGLQSMSPGPTGTDPVGTDPAGTVPVGTGNARTGFPVLSAPGPFWCGTALSHADIALACAVRFAAEAHPGLVDLQALPALGAFCGMLEAMPVFRAISQPFAPPA